MRNKRKIAYITRKSTRRSSFQIRRKGLLKKVNELSTLCGISACAIVYGENETRPEIWPPSPTSVSAIISKFKEMTVLEQSKKMLNQESFLMERIAKAKDQLKKLKKDNKEKELTDMMYKGANGLMPPEWLEGLSSSDLKSLNSTIKKTLSDIDEKQKAMMLELERAESSISEENVEPPNVGQSLVESMANEEWFKNLLEPPEPPMSPFENVLNPGSPTWTYP